MKKEILVYVIEDDESVRRAFAILLQSAGFHVQAFSSADEFLEREVLSDNSCIILDMRMPGISGLESSQETVISEQQTTRHCCFCL